MKPTRREILRAAGAMCALSAGSSGQAGAHGQRASPATEMKPLDYGRSFICHPGPVNAVRFWVESRTRLIDDRAGTWADFYQCGACKGENTFGKKDLFLNPNYDFMPIIGGDHVLIFRRPAQLSAKYRQVKKPGEVWGAPILQLVEALGATELGTWEQIREATASAIAIVTQTTLANAETGLRAVIECPTKTMNISLENRLYQVDTGPVALPDLSNRTDPAIECLSLAFIAFNAPDFADFVIEQPTPVLENGQEKCKVYHYSNPFSLPAHNRLFGAPVS